MPLSCARWRFTQFGKKRLVETIAFIEFFITVFIPRKLPPQMVAIYLFFAIFTQFSQEPLNNIQHTILEGGHFILPSQFQSLKDVVYCQWSKAKW